MRRIFAAVLVTALFVPVICSAAEIETDSAIRAVTVYTNRAKLTRQATVDVPAGAHTVIFKDLPAGIMTDSLRVEGRAQAAVKFGALAHRQDIKKDLIAPREKELNDKLEMLQDQRRLAEAEKAALAAQKTFLENLGKQAELRSDEEIAELNLKPEQWGAAAETIRAGLAEILSKGIVFDVKIRALDKEIQKVQREIGQLYTGQKITWQVSVPVEAAAATKLTVDLSYQVSNATWRPLYDARLDTDSGKLELVQYGAVRQQTGEDWEKVDLTLSTAQPHRGAGLPDLNPWWVNVWKHDSRARPAREVSGVSMLGGRASNMAAAPEMMAMDAAVMSKTEGFADVPEERQAVFAQAEIDTGGFVSEYKITGPADVPADGTETKLMVGAFETENEMQVQVKPQLSAEAYLTARAVLKGEAPVLPGQVSLFRDGAYVGQSHLPLLRPGEEQDLPFGIDDQVAVKRHTMKDERSEDGVISKDSVLERRFVTELQNLHKQPVTLVVMETIPAPQDEKIKVEIVKNATTPGYETDKSNVRGLMEWKFEVAAKEKKDVKIGWKISWPSDHQISGM